MIGAGWCQIFTCVIKNYEMYLGYDVLHNDRVSCVFTGRRKVGYDVGLLGTRYWCEFGGFMGRERV